MKSISLDEFKAILEKGPLEKEKIFDARRPDEFKAVHIRGAENIPYDTVSSKMHVFQNLDKIYFYCSSGKRCKLACETLEKEGIDPNKLVHVMGMSEDWEKTGIPVVIGSGSRFPIQRQVYLLASSLTLIGLILALIVNLWFILIPFLVASGMFFAAVSGTCFGELMLSKLPWNR